MVNMIMRYVTLTCIIFALGACVQVAHASDCHLRVGWEPSWPYIYDQDDEIQGSDYKILSDIAADAGCRLKMLNIPQSRAIRMLERYEVDMVSATTYTKEHTRIAHFSQPYRYENIMLVAHFSLMPEEKGDVSLHEWINMHQSENAPTILGVLNESYHGHAVDDILNKNWNKTSITEFDNKAEMVSMLQTGEIHGFIVEEGVAQAHQELYTPDIVIRHITEQDPDPLHFLFSQSVEKWVIEHFDQSIQAHRRMTQN